MTWHEFCDVEGPLFGKTNYIEQAVVDMISRTIDGPQLKGPHKKN